MATGKLTDDLNAYVTTLADPDTPFAILVNRETKIFYVTLDEARTAARTIKEQKSVCFGHRV